jgi:hypothetical protein
MKIHFYGLVTKGRNIGKLLPKEVEPTKHKHIDQYFKKLVGRELYVQCKFASVNFKIISWKKGTMKVVVNHIKHPDWSITDSFTLKGHKDFITTMVDDKIMTLTNQYFNEYAAPDRKILYFKYSFLFFKTYSVL